MALIGGGGAGNVAGGANPSGTGSNINFIGRSRIDDRNYWSGYSGLVLVESNVKTQFDFVAPNVATIATYVFTNTGIAGSNQYVGYVVEIDGQTVIDARFFNSAGGINVTDLDVPITISIPAEAIVTISGQASDSENHNTFGSLILKEI